MPFDEHLANRIAENLLNRSIDFEEKRMFGGLCYMIDDKMCIGVSNDDFMARVNPDQELELLSKDGTRPMDFTKRPMRGYLFIVSSGYDTDEDLDFWIQQCLDFNPVAKSSKKKAKKN